MVFSEFIKVSVLLLMIVALPFWIIVWRYAINALKVLGALVVILGISLTLPWDGYGGIFDQLGVTGYLVAVSGLVVFALGVFQRFCDQRKRGKR
ncbi:MULTISPECIES: hypothetical protein [Pseudomonas]|uniref:hypothetical protein n=1 Tax=Pseudomonas TaxID=286 RepID=UPI00070C9B25|nr:MULTISPECIES: hypothetical protein [Pseudomonas]KQW19916.1 hypothetical protein ASC85_08700 [Pseudomonas sp. Root401]WHS57502.1 hypothetical protein QLH64_29575 [Pseudomonas brassicacearum]